MSSEAMTPLWLRRYTKLTAASTLFLIFAGAMVTSTGSGLAVPDWPLSYGQLMPPMVGGIFYEHGHRMIASAVGLLTLIQAFWLQSREPKRFVRRLGWVALAAVIIQGLLGGLTVLFLLPTAISVSHAALAEIFFCINVSIAFFTSATWHRWSVESQRSPHRPLATASKVLVGLVFIQILIGAVMRHMGAGLAIPDFPLSHGRLVPTFESSGIVVNYMHRLGAVAVTIATVMTASLAIRSARAAVRRLSGGLVILVAIQITLGAYTVWSAKHPITTSLHVVTGASILAVSLLLALSSHRASAIDPANEMGEGSRVPA